MNMSSRGVFTVAIINIIFSIVPIILEIQNTFWGCVTIALVFHMIFVIMRFLQDNIRIIKIF